MKDLIFTPRRLARVKNAEQEEESKVPGIVICIKSKKLKEQQISPASSPEQGNHGFTYFPAVQNLPKHSEKTAKWRYLRKKVSIKDSVLPANISPYRKVDRNTKKIEKHFEQGKEPSFEKSPSTPKPFRIFPSTFKVKKKIQANSIYYPVTPEPVRFSIELPKVENVEEKEKRNLSKPRTPNFISTGSYRANFFSSRIDKILHKHRLHIVV